MVLKEARCALQLMNIDKVNVQRDQLSAVLFHVCGIPQGLFSLPAFLNAVYCFVEVTEPFP